MDSEERLIEVIDLLKPPHFYSDANALIYQAVLGLTEMGASVNVMSVCQWLEDRERLREAGGKSYVQLVKNTLYVLKVREQAQRVVDLWTRRQIIALCQRIAAEGYGDIGEQRVWVDGLEQSLFELARDGSPSTMERLSPLLTTVFRQVQDAANRGSRISGRSTGYERLDAKTAGLHDGDLMIIAGRPGMAKTSLALNLAVNVASPADDSGALSPGAGVAIFSLEMPREQLATRMVCSEARVDLGKLRQGYLQAEDWRQLTEASSFLHTLPVWIDDAPAPTVLELRAKIRRIQAEYDRPAAEGQTARRVGLVIVDYIQLMKGRDGVQSREQEVSEISRGLKQLAKELRVPVVALAQLNRAVETRTTKDKRPQLSDLRESGSLEQDADTVIMLYRDEYYNEDSNAKGIAELLIRKQRNGPTGTVLLRFSAACTRFDNLAAGDYPQTEDE
jgi:replicative DNA helicase